MCVKGCYRCLLSYFNQPDHEHIDRTDEDALRLLIDLARGTLTQSQRQNRSEADQKWEAKFAEAELPAPDQEEVTLADMTFPFAWRSHFVAATTEAIADAAMEAAATKGWSLFTLPSDANEPLPDDFIQALKG